MQWDEGWFQLFMPQDFVSAVKHGSNIRICVECRHVDIHVRNGSFVEHKLCAWKEASTLYQHFTTRWWRVPSLNQFFFLLPLSFFKHVYVMSITSKPTVVLQWVCAWTCNSFVLSGAHFVVVAWSTLLVTHSRHCQHCFVRQHTTHSDWIILAR